MRKLFYLMFSLLILVSCQPDNVEQKEEQELNRYVDSAELATFEAPVEVYDFAGFPLLVQEVDGLRYHQGDMIIPELEEPIIYASVEDVPKGPDKSTSRISGLWEGNIVYYQIDPDLPDKSRVAGAIKMWTDAVPQLKFINSPNIGGYLYFQRGSSCASFVGKIGGKQGVVISERCTVGNTAHEIGHALGLWHEQSRADRDRFIKVMLENVVDGAEHNFETYKQMGRDGQELTSELDFESIMMYGSYAFSKNGEPTILTKDGNFYNTNRAYLSKGDIEGMRKLYPESGEPVYENYNYYIVDGLPLARADDRWWYYTSMFGFKEVAQRRGRWYYK